MSISPNSMPSFGQPAGPPPPLPPEPSSGGGGWKFGLLLGAVVALVAASGYLYYRVNTLSKDLETTRENLAAELTKLQETSSVSAQTQRRNVDTLKGDLEAERRRIAQLSGEAKQAAMKHADELATKLQRAQQEQAQQIKAEVSDVKTAATAANTRIGEVSSEVGTVKSDVAATKSELEKTIASLRSAQGDLSSHSSLIATNAKELSALRALGERIFTEFKLGKSKAPQRVGDVSIRLKAADPKRNKYTIELIADDKTREMKDKNIYEPVQFMLSKAALPFEIVVNDVKKDLIAGYLSAPKVQSTRGSN